jgi:hypothetical protein
MKIIRQPHVKEEERKEVIVRNTNSLQLRLTPFQSIIQNLYPLQKLWMEKRSG